MIQDMRYWAQEAPERVAVAIEEQSLTYGELEENANRLARLFGQMGLARGDHVAVLLSNTPFVFVAAWAAYRCGLYLTPVSTALSAPDAAYIVGNCQARVAIVQEQARISLRELSRLVQHPVQWLSHGAPASGFASVQDLMKEMGSESRPDESPGAIMFYTSGTTGAPKGVWRPLPPVSYTGTPPFAADLLDLFGFDQASRYLSTAPLYHAAPLRFSLAVTAAGGTVFGFEKFDAERALQALMDLRITHSQWVPTMFQRLLRLPESLRSRYRTAHHRVAVHAAAPCPVPVKRAMIDWWGPILTEYYSGSEGVGLTIIDSEEWLQRPGSVGRAWKGVPHVLDDDWAELPAGKVGRIYFSGVTPFQYFGAEKKTADRTSPQGYQTLGDIGYLDAQGYMYLTDRMDDMIISGGVNVYPQEIEDVLIELDEVLDAGVVGMPDDEFGERPVASVVVADPTDIPAVIARLQAYCASRLGKIKQPAKYFVMDELPRSPTGKLLRRALREQLPK